MKKLIMLLLAHICWDSSVFAQCENNAFVFSISPGYSRTGVTFAMEAGLWPAAGRVGIMGGPIMYNRQQVGKYKTETLTDLDFEGRIIYKLTALGSNSPQLVTLFGTVKGMLGISYRGYISLSENDLIGIEPFYANRVGAGVNIIFTTKL
jgi:hypothetical protein